MRLNGETKTLKDPVALSDFLTQEGFSDKRIAVERNGEIVPKGEYFKCIKITFFTSSRISGCTILVKLIVSVFLIGFL